MNEIVNNIINDSSPLLGDTIGIFQFNNFDLTSLLNNTTGYILKTSNELSLDNVIIEEFVSEIIDGGTIIDKRYGNSSVPFTLFIQASNYQDLLDKIYDLKKNLNDKNGFLFITRNGIVYQYTATCNSIIIPAFSTNDTSIDNIQLNFIITSPHGTIREAETSFIQPVADFSKIINNIGTYKSYPKIILIGKAGSTITDINIELKKVGDISGESLFVNDSIGDGDVLILDYNEKTVILNDVEIPFDGFMTALETGMNVFDFTFTGNVNIDAYILYNKTFL